MPCLFPGMDPFLEGSRVWRDFHTRFITYWSDALCERLPSHYEVRIEDRVVLEAQAGTTRHFGIGPDIAVHQDLGAPRGVAEVGGVATMAPVTLENSVTWYDKVRHKSLKIFHHPGRKLVAVLELLSPSNKYGADRTVYMSKRDRILLRRVHLVEIDLLRGGRRIPLLGELPAGDYYAMISRGDRRPKCDVYAWSIRQPLPTLPIPLRAPDPDVAIDLQAVFATTFERGRYARSIAYDQPPEVPFRAEDGEWIAARLRAAHA